MPIIRLVDTRGRPPTDHSRIGGGAINPVARRLGGGLGHSSLGVFVVEVNSRPSFDRNRRSQMLRQGREWTVPSDYEAVIAEFVRTKGITRCPTACVLPTQGSIDPADQVALEKHAVAHERLRQTKAAARARVFWNVSFPPPGEK